MQCELDLLVSLTDIKTRPNNVLQRPKLVKRGKWERIEVINKQSYPRETLQICSLMRVYLPLHTPQLQRLHTCNITFFKCGQVTRACWLWYLDCWNCRLVSCWMYSFTLWGSRLKESSLWVGVLFFSGTLNVQQHLIPFLVSVYCGNRKLRYMGLSRHSKLWVGGYLLFSLLIALCRSLSCSQESLFCPNR